jgi:hypothetical protein
MHSSGPPATPAGPGRRATFGAMRPGLNYAMRRLGMPRRSTPASSPGPCPAAGPARDWPGVAIATLLHLPLAPHPRPEMQGGSGHALPDHRREADASHGALSTVTAREAFGAPRRRRARPARA